MTDELSSTTRALLDAARKGLGPDDAAVARMRAKVDVAVSGSAAAGAIALGTKLALLVVVGAVVLVVALATRGDSEPTAPIAGVTVEIPALPSQIEQTARETPPTVSEPPVIEMPATPARPQKLAAKKPVTLAREVELVDRAMTALRANDTAGALTAIHMHAAETGGAGQLAEDATAIEIEAICTRRNAAALQRLAVFDKRWPHSAQRARLTKVCR